MTKLLPEEIALDKYEDVAKILPILVNNGYATMVTREEDLWIVSYIYAEDTYCEQANRNNVVLMDRGIFELDYEERVHEDELGSEGTDYE